VDHTSDDWKKDPLVVIGSLPAIPPGAVSIAPAALGAPGTPCLNDFYVVVALTSESRPATLIALAAGGVAEQQVVVYLRPGECAPTGEFGSLEALDGESNEELRARLLNKLQSQRQRQLPAALRIAHEQGLDHLVAEPTLTRTLDITRIAHALCCGYSLSPAVHARVLRDCLAGAYDVQSSWAGEISPEILVPGAAEGVHRALVKGVSVREALRDRLVPLSYRARTELLHHCESCVGAVTGARHAA
jgi:hypothetical protein